MSSLERTAAEIIAGLLLLVGFILYERHAGARACIAADDKAVAAQIANNINAQATQKVSDSQAEITLDAIPSVDPGSLPELPASLSACPSQVPTTRTVIVKGDYTPTIRTPASASVVPPSWTEFERSDVQGGRDADGEVIYLQSLLKAQYKLCGGK